MNTINDIAASVGFTKPAKRMLNRDEQVKKYMNLAKQTMISSQLSASQAQGTLEILRSIEPGGVAAAQVRERAERHARAAEQAAEDARLYLDRAIEAMAATEFAIFEDL